MEIEWSGGAFTVFDIRQQMQVAPNPFFEICAKEAAIVLDGNCCGVGIAVRFEFWILVSLID